MGCIPKNSGENLAPGSWLFYSHCFWHISSPSTNFCKSLEGYLNKREPPASRGISLESGCEYSNPHASPSRLSANSFFLVHTHRQRKMAHTHLLRYRGAHTTEYMLYSHTQKFMDFIQGINKSFQTATGRRMTLTLFTQLVKSRVKKWSVAHDTRRLLCGQSFWVKTEIAERGSTAEQPLGSVSCLLNNALLDICTGF